MNENFFCENSIGLLILAGGRSLRMGRDKSLLTIGGESFLGRLASNMGDYGERLLSANDGKELAGFVTVADKREIAGKGPMAGIASALAECGSGRLMVIPCDAPFMDASAARILAETASAGGEFLTVPVVAEGNRGPEPVIGIYPKETGTLIEVAILRGVYKAADILKEIGYVSVKLPPEKLININRPEDYAKYGQRR